MKIPGVEDFMKDMKVGCSGCAQMAPFTLREWETIGPDLERAKALAHIGWQMRLIATDLLWEDEPARSWRWDLFCPACAGEMSPRPEGTFRLRSTEKGLELWKPEE